MTPTATRNPPEPPDVYVIAGPPRAGDEKRLQPHVGLQPHTGLRPKEVHR